MPVAGRCALRTAVLGLVWVLVCDARADVRLTMMTYNIGAAGPIYISPSDLVQIAQEIHGARADVVGMQEVDIGDRDGHAYFIDMVATVSDELDALGYSMNSTYVEYMAYDTGNIVLALFSRYPIVATDWVSTLPPPSTRKALEATIQYDASTFVHCFVVHYYIGDGSYHQVQTDALLDYAQQFQGPKVLLGDFNFDRWSTYYAQVTGAGYQDSCVASEATDCLTVGTGAGIVAPLPRVGQIDFVFGSSDIDFTCCYVPSTTMSDHWPLVASGRDGDADGVCDAFDACPGTPAGLPVNQAGCWVVMPGSGDLDGDGDVDQSDFGHFQRCLKGAGIAQTDLDCLDAHMDIDVDVDQTDLAIFRGRMSGAGIPAVN